MFLPFIELCEAKEDHLVQSWKGERKEERRRGEEERKGERRRGKEGGLRGGEEATINGRYLTRYMLQNVSYSPKYISSILLTNKVSATINKCQVLYHTQVHNPITGMAGITWKISGPLVS